MIPCKYISIGYFLLMCFCTNAQSGNSIIRSANKLFKDGKYEKAISQYKKAVEINPENPIAHYNIGNAFFSVDKWEDAAKSYDDALSKSTDERFREKALYNKGVSFSKQKKLEESIDAYKSALKLQPADEDARINLQKALMELKKKMESEEKKENKEQKKESKKPQQKDKPNPQQSKLTKKQVEQLLKALAQKEQQVQQKMQENKNRSTTQPDKDW